MASPEPVILALDTASPVVSVALARGGEVAASRTVELARSSEALLGMVDEVLAEGGADLADLTGVVALAGPGSFTGLRVGLATVLGLHQALGLPATALPTLAVLAALAPGRGGTVVAAVDALRGEWCLQAFAAGSPPRPLGDPRLVPEPEIPGLGPCQLVGFGLEGLAPSLPPAIELVEPGPLAGAAARLASRHPPAWDADLLTRPLYARPPAATPLPR